MRASYLFLGGLIFCFLPSCKTAQYVFTKSSHDFSIPRFDVNKIKPATEVFQFHELEEAIKNGLLNFPSYSKRTIEEIISQDKDLTAFILIKNDTIIYEKYLEPYKKNELRQTFSLSKAFLSAIAGILIEEGCLSLEDPVTKYFPELMDKEKYWSTLTIKHLLNMRSGIKYQEFGFKIPYHGIGLMHSSKNLEKYAFKSKFKESPGSRTAYSSMDSQILGLIIEKVTKKNLSTLLEEKIWSRIGMESDASWAVDSKKNNNTKAYCCIEARVRDLARFTRLFLKGGKYNGEQIIPSKWIENTFGKANYDWCMQNYWWSKQNYPKHIYKDELTTIPNYYKDSTGATIDTVIGKRRGRNCGAPYYIPGLGGQLLYVHPEENLIAVRLAKGENEKTFSDLNEITWILNHSENIYTDQMSLNCETDFKIDDHLGLYCYKTEEQRTFCYSLIKSKEIYAVLAHHQIASQYPIRIDADCRYYFKESRAKVYLEFEENKFKPKFMSEYYRRNMPDSFEKVKCQCQESFDVSKAYEFGDQVLYQGHCYSFIRNEYSKQMPEDESSTWLKCKS